MVTTGRILAQFFLPVVPSGMARPRFSRITGGTFKDKTQRDRERELDAHLRLHTPKSQINGPVSVEMDCLMPIPVSTTKRRRIEMESLFELPTKRPDLDNMAKQLLDGLTRCEFWGDDAQVCGLIALKYFARRPGWKVIIRECVLHEG